MLASKVMRIQTFAFNLLHACTGHSIYNHFSELNNHKYPFRKGFGFDYSYVVCTTSKILNTLHTRLEQVICGVEC